MYDGIRVLADARRAREQAKEDVDRIKAEIEAQFGDALRRAHEVLEEASLAVAAIDEVTRAFAVDWFNATDDKKPHPAVTVKMYTILEYDPAVALDYCTKHLPKALRLDRRAFEKVAKVLEPDFVTFCVEPRATILSKLEEYETKEECDAVRS
jgi:hypothetical protein